MDFRDKVVLITGASSGIGEACAGRFAAAGARVVLTARSADKLQKIAARLALPEQAVIPADLAEPADPARLAEQTIRRFGRVDVLLNNAGVGLYTPSLETPPDHVRRLFEVNLFAPIELCRLLLPVMPAGSTVVNVSSIGGKVPLPWQTIYGASKFALNAYSDALRMELHGTGVRVLSVCPGYVDTGFSSHALEGTLAAKIAAGRPFRITPERCAEAIFEGVRKGKRTVVTPRIAWLLVVASRLAPRLVYARMARMNAEPQRVEPGISGS